MKNNTEMQQRLNFGQKCKDCGEKLNKRKILEQGETK